MVQKKINKINALGNKSNIPNEPSKALLEKNKSSKNHIFYEFDKNLKFSKFEDSQFDLKIQKTSNDTYLKKNKIESYKEVISKLKLRK